jgi:predicted SprT family Zn-dependent metalloprotease
MAWRPWRRASAEGPPYCSFCQQPSSRQRRVIQRADGLFICDQCVERVLAALSNPELRRLTRVT